MEGTDGLAAFLVGKFGDTACVYHDYVGLFPSADTGYSRVGECLCNRGCLREVELASEGVVKRL